MSDEKGEKCQRCGEIGADRWPLLMACFYDMSELGIPFDRKVLATLADPLDTRDFFLLRVCKRCRAEWMQAIKDWFETNPHEREVSPGDSAIYIRRFGHEVPVSREEFEKMRRAND